MAVNVSYSRDVVVNGAVLTEKVTGVYQRIEDVPEDIRGIAAIQEVPSDADITALAAVEAAAAEAAAAVTAQSIADAGDATVAAAIPTEGEIEDIAEGEAVAVAANRKRAILTSSAHNVTGTPSAVVFDAEPVDVGALWSAGSPTRITIPSAPISGVWVFHAKVSISPSSTGGSFSVGWQKNGTDPVLGGGAALPILHTGSFVDLQVMAMIVDPTAGDYYELIVTQGSGGTLSAISVAQVVHL